MAAKSRSAAPRLEQADLSLKLTTDDYEHRLGKLQRKLVLIQQAYLASGRKAVIVFEGWDAAGKGGTIRRISMALDPRSFKVWPIGAPRRYYLERHFLLRFMERLPPSGAIAVFDRSWYGRVLVERVEGLIPRDRWEAGYREICDFERMLIGDGNSLVKLFFHISPEVQLARFESRLRDPLKRWKLSHEDFRNRNRWNDYMPAINDMFTHTSTSGAPWKVIPANTKKYARIAAMEEIVKSLGRGIRLGPAPVDEAVVDEARKHFDLDPALLASLRQPGR